MKDIVEVNYNFINPDEDEYTYYLKQWHQDAESSPKSVICSLRHWVDFVPKEVSFKRFCRQINYLTRALGPILPKSDVMERCMLGIMRLDKENDIVYPFMSKRSIVVSQSQACDLYRKVYPDYTKNGISCVQDSSVFGDSCFVEMLRGDKIPDVEVDVYSELFTEMAEYMMYPSAVVFLKCAPEIALNRIKHRGRECEAGIPIDYLRSLDEQLNRLSESMKRFTHVIELDVNADMNEEQLQQEAHELYVNICCLRATPILSRLGQ
jgi:deoxyadenosine/deoxycytidine kinase